ncbi:hypothetical protein NC652_029976 [Populus alba x Populus x berolinensis]|nr:hypothetical protein NC652_029976 [Populus alba x Populus x berolinensis]
MQLGSKLYWVLLRRESNSKDPNPKQLGLHVPLGEVRLERKGLKAKLRKAGNNCHHSRAKKGWSALRRSDSGISLINNGCYVIQRLLLIDAKFVSKCHNENCVSTH